MENSTLTMEEVSQATITEFAGFWLRFAAVIIDSIVLTFAQYIVVLPVLALIGVSTSMDFAALESNPEMFTALLGSIMYMSLGTLVIGWLYSALMESSSKQATIGKMAVGIKVTDMNGDRISFLHATGRFFGKYISALILFIGYFMAGFTQKKQALHDILAGTLVIRK